MRTSASQFELLVSFMERHGDLSKPSSQPHGRLTNLKLWGELCTLLNADAGGDAKSEEKWKKTWSDLKNNTKRKAAKLHRAATGTGGGPAIKCSLTLLEERVLLIINPQSATGLVDVPEVGFEQDPVHLVSVADVAEIEEFAAIDSLENWDEPGPSQQTQSPPPNPSPPPIPTPGTKRPADNAGAHTKRRLAMSQSEIARESFLQNDRDWRAFTEAQQNKNYELEKERLRLREIELELQAKWQEICARFLSVLEALTPNLINK